MTKANGKPPDWRALRWESLGVDPGPFLRRFRVEFLQVSPEEFAKMTGCSERCVIPWEKGKMPPPFHLVEWCMAVEQTIELVSRVITVPLPFDYRGLLLKGGLPALLDASVKSVFEWQNR